MVDCPYCSGERQVPDGYYHEQYRHVVRSVDDLILFMGVKPSDTPFKSGLRETL